MIHVEIEQVLGRIKENHGQMFVAKANEISRKWGHEVPLTDNTTDLEASTGNLKTVCVMIIIKKDGTVSFAIIGMNLWNSYGKEIVERWKRIAVGQPSWESVSFRQITTPKWTAMSLRFPIQRKTNFQFTVYKNLSQMEIEDLSKNGKVLDKILLY